MSPDINWEKMWSIVLVGAEKNWNILGPDSCYTSYIYIVNYRYVDRKEIFLNILGFCKSSIKRKKLQFTMYCTWCGPLLLEILNWFPVHGKVTA